MAVILCQQDRIWVPLNSRSVEKTSVSGRCWPSSFTVVPSKEDLTCSPALHRGSQSGLFSKSKQVRCFPFLRGLETLVGPRYLHFFSCQSVYNLFQKIFWCCFLENSSRSGQRRPPTCWIHPHFAPALDSRDYVYFAYLGILGASLVSSTEQVLNKYPRMNEWACVLHHMMSWGRIKSRI